MCGHVTLRFWKSIPLLLNREDRVVTEQVRKSVITLTPCPSPNGRIVESYAQEGGLARDNEKNTWYVVTGVRAASIEASAASNTDQYSFYKRG